jgi:hypothetical protein
VVSTKAFSGPSRVWTRVSALPFPVAPGDPRRPHPAVPRFSATWPNPLEDIAKTPVEDAKTSPYISDRARRGNPDGHTGGRPLGAGPGDRRSGVGTPDHHPERAVRAGDGTQQPGWDRKRDHDLVRGGASEPDTLGWPERRTGWPKGRHRSGREAGPGGTERCRTPSEEARKRDLPGGVREPREGEGASRRSLGASRDVHTRPRRPHPSPPSTPVPRRHRIPG